MRVGIAEDSTVVRQAFEELLASIGATVVASAATGTDLAATIDADPPDVVIIDMRMPPTQTNEGLVAARRIRRRHPRVAVLAVSADDEAPYARELLRGAEPGIGYLLKRNVTCRTALLLALQRVVAHQCVVDADIAAAVLAGPAARAKRALLDAGEEAALDLFAQGWPSSAVAAQLSLGADALAERVRALSRKIGVELDGVDGDPPGDQQAGRTVVRWLFRSPW